MNSAGKRYGSPGADSPRAGGFGKLGNLHKDLLVSCGCVVKFDKKAIVRFWKGRCFLSGMGRV